MIDDPAVQLTGALERTRTLTAIAIGCAIAIPLSVLGLRAWSLALAPLLLLGQVGLGIAACVIGRRAAAVADALDIPRSSAALASVRNWAAYGLIVALLGVLGVVAAAVLAVLAIAALGSMGGAWGRPLQVNGRPARAATGGGTSWARGPRPMLEGLDATTREALGRLWGHDAIKEHGSVPAFAQVTWDLAALGAPAALLVRCNASALQEIDHAERCFAVTETYLGRTIEVGPIAAATRGLGRRRGLRRCAIRVAIETLEDGCLIEDLNADFAERARTRATDPAMLALVDCIAREEREHAALAWDILAFCLTLHPDVAKAVRRAVGKLPDHIMLPYDLPTLAIVGRADPLALVAHGRVPFAEWSGIHEHRRAATISRALALLDATTMRARDDVAWAHAAER